MAGLRDKPFALVTVNVDAKSKLHPNLWTRCVRMKGGLCHPSCR
jgi:hypothetical protein